MRRLLLSQFAEDDFSRLERQTLYTKREKLWFAVVNRARTTFKTPKGCIYAFSFYTVINLIVLIVAAVAIFPFVNGHYHPELALPSRVL